MIPGKSSLALAPAAVTEALRRFLCDELKTPIKVVGWKANKSGYGPDDLTVEFEAAEAAAETPAAGSGAS